MTPPLGPPLLRFDGVSHTFGDVEVLSDLNLAVQPGEFVALVGPVGLRQDDAAEPVLGMAGADQRPRRTGPTACAWSSSRTACFRGSPSPRTSASGCATSPTRPRAPDRPTRCST